MEKKHFFLVLAIALIIVSNSFAQDTPGANPALFYEQGSSSFDSDNIPGAMLMTKHHSLTTDNHELDEVLSDDFENFDDDYESDSISDPLYHFNYLMHNVNDFLYFKAIKPIAKGYKAIMPVPVRKGLKNFFHNLIFPVRFVNNILQGEIKDAGSEVGIFVINTTIGVLGFGQVAQNEFDFHTANEDLGQTLGSYSIGNGFYLVLPILGPSTFRDLIGRVGDSFLNPVNYVEPWGYSAGIKALETINTVSFRLGDYETLKKASLDPYVAIRNAYVENRKEKIKE